MRFYSRRLVMPEHLNSANRLFGGTLLSWIDEETYIFARCQLKQPKLVTRFMSEVNFVASAEQGDIIEFGIETTAFGISSVTLACQVRNKDSGKVIINIERIVFVAVDEYGDPTPHSSGIDSLAA